MNMNAIDALEQLFGAAPSFLLLLLIGIIFVIYLTAFVPFLGAAAKSSGSASEEALTELRDFCQSHSLSEEALRQRLSLLDKQDDSSYYIVLFDICRNEHVTPGILRCFIEYFPGAVRCVHLGMTPLHDVLFNKNCTVDIVRCLIYPDALLSRDDDGITPLTILCWNRKLDEIEALEILRLFVEECPQCVQIRSKGFLPIEFAVTRKHSLEFCFVLVHAFPESIIRHEVARVPLLVSLLQSPDIDDSIAFALLNLLLESHPDMIRHFRWNTDSVLHLVAKTNIRGSVELCRLLINKFPDLVFVLADLDNVAQVMPLHTACSIGNLPIVKCILDMRPDAISYACSSGLFPIHCAIAALSNNEVESLQVVKYLLSVNVSVASQRSTNGTTPLILACRLTTASNLNSGLEVILSIFNAHPNAIYDIASNAREDNTVTGAIEVVANFLIANRGYAETANDLRLVRTPDENGNLPIHHALHNGAPLGTIELLAQADPTTLQMTTRNGNTLLHEACRLRNYGVIELLMTRFATAKVCTSITNSLGKFPIQILLENDYDTQDSTRHLNCIFLLLRANPTILMHDANILESPHLSCIYRVLRANPSSWINETNLVTD